MRKYRLLALVAPIVIITKVGMARAACEPCTSGLCNPISSCTFGDLVANLAKAVAAIGVPLVAIFLIWSGFLFVTSQGDPKKLTEAKQAFYWAVIGGAVVIGAYALASAIVNFAQKL